MPKLMPLYMLSAVVIAAAGSSAFAQGAKVAPKSNVKVMTANGSTTAAGQVNSNVVIQSPRTGGDVARNSRDSVGGTDGSAVFTPSTTTTTDVRNNDNRRQTEGTRASGSSATTTGTGTPAGTDTTTGTNTGTGTTSGTGTTGSSSVNSTGTVTNPDNTQTSSGDSSANANTTATNPLLLNSVIGAGVAGSDAVLDEQNAALTGTSNPAQADATLSANSAVSSTPAADTVRANASLDRVINQAARDRRKIGRNGQLLNSIAPRTNVDRSDEMPDDGPTPALKGLISR